MNPETAIWIREQVDQIASGTYASVTDKEEFEEMNPGKKWEDWKDKPFLRGEAE